MRPYKIEIYIYAETDDEALSAQKALRDFVRGKYDNGILVTAGKIVNALKKFKDNFMLNQFLK